MIMKKYLLFVLFLPMQLLAQTSILGTEKIEISADITASENGLVLLGTTQNAGANFDLWMHFVDTLGNSLSQKIFGGQGKDMAAKIVSTSGGYFLLGTTHSAELSGYHGLGDILLVKTNVLGNQLWMKTFGGSQFDHATSMVATNDGGVVFVASTQSSDGNISNTFGQADAMICKVDASGAIEWTKTFGGSATDTPNDIVATTNGYMVVGTSFSNDGLLMGNHGQSDIWVLGINNSGALLWSKTFGEDAFDYGQALCKVDGGFLVVGALAHRVSSETNIIDRYNQELMAIKLDDNGNVIWQKEYGTQRVDIGHDVYPMQLNNEVLILGYSEEGPVNTYDPYQTTKNAWTLKLDSNGNKIWETTTTGSNNEYGVAIGANENHGVVVVIGDTDSPNGSLISNGQKDVWMTKYADTPIANDNLYVSQTVQLYPNPIQANQLLQLESTNLIQAVGIYRMDGSLLQALAVKHGTIDIGQLPAGAYVLQIRFQDGRQVVKKLEIY